MRTRYLSWLALAGVIAGVSPASASFMVSPMPTGTGINAISAACTNPSGAPATTIDGCLNVSHNTVVKFDSTDTIDFLAGGQAKIAPSGSTTFDNMTTSLVGYTFDTFVINIETAVNGSVTFSDNFGDTSTQSLSKNGNNFFTITGMDFSWINFASTVNAVDVKQVRFGGLRSSSGSGSGNPPPFIPEPATLALFGAALAGLGALRRRKI